MRSAVYLLILLLLVPVQASLLAPFARFGFRPDLGLAVLYSVGLLTGPIEGALFGILLGLLQDASSAGLFGLSGLSHGILGLLAGLLGRRVLDTSSPSNIVFLVVFGLAESLMIAIFLETTYGDVPFWSLVFRRMLPGAIATAIIGFLLLRFAARRNILRLILRRTLQQEL